MIIIDRPHPCRCTIVTTTNVGDATTSTVVELCPHCNRPCGSTVIWFHAPPLPAVLMPRPKAPRFSPPDLSEEPPRPWLPARPPMLDPRAVASFPHFRRHARRESRREPMLEEVAA